MYQPVEIDSEHFTGRVLMRIKDFVGVTPDGSDPIKHLAYFEKRSRKFCMQWEGRFKQEWNADEVWFGTDFDKRVPIPKEPFEIGMRIAKMIDPAMFYNLNCDRPYVQSPIVCGINTFSAWPCPDAESRALVGLRHVEQDPDGDDFVPTEELTKSGKRKPKSYWRFIGFKEPAAQLSANHDGDKSAPPMMRRTSSQGSDGNQRSSSDGSTNGIARIPLKERFSTLGKANRNSMDLHEFLGSPSHEIGAGGFGVGGTSPVSELPPPMVNDRSPSGRRNYLGVSNNTSRGSSGNSTPTQSQGNQSGLRKMFSKLKVVGGKGDADESEEADDEKEKPEPSLYEPSIYEDARDDIDMSPLDVDKRNPRVEQKEAIQQNLKVDTGSGAQADAATLKEMSSSSNKPEPLQVVHSPAPIPSTAPPNTPASTTTGAPDKSSKRRSLFGSYMPSIWASDDNSGDSSPIPSEITTADKFHHSTSPSSSHPASPHIVPHDKKHGRQPDPSKISTKLDSQLGPWRWTPDTDPLEDNLFVFGKESGPQSVNKRRKYFLDKNNRAKFKYDKDVVYCCSFFSPHMDFNTFSLKLGLSINIFGYLQGMPVRYVCRAAHDDNIVFFVVEFNLVDA